MKKFILVFMFAYVALALHAECFSTQIYFEDKDGNKDSLVVGYSDYFADCELQTDSWAEADAMQSLQSGEHWAWFGNTLDDGESCEPHRIHINYPTAGFPESYRIRIWYPQDRLPITVS